MHFDSKTTILVLLVTAMAINVYRNKPFGPGGGTRRLHQSPASIAEYLWGRNRIDDGVKDMISPGMVPPYRTKFLVANDNYAEARMAA